MKNILHLIVVIIPVLTGCISSSKSIKLSGCGTPIPQNVPGLTINGPRTKTSIIEDMAPILCAIQFQYINDAKQSAKTHGNDTVPVKVLVEYTGEVAHVTILENSFGDNDFIRRIEDIIMNSDFTFWGHDQQDTEFIYPIPVTQ